MAYPPPKVVGHGAERMQFICYAVFKPEQRVKAGMSLAGPGPRDICAKALFRDRDDGFYLFSCDSEWRVMFDTNHETLDEAHRQAEFEHSGISESWVWVKSR